MSRFSNTYKPISSFSLVHDDSLRTEEYLTFFPDKNTSKLISKYKLRVVPTPDGLIVLYKKNEHFDSLTKDETILIDGVPVINKKVIGYTKNGNSSNWLPNPADLTLTFYGIANNEYKRNTIWKDLNLNKYVQYSSSSLNGAVKTGDFITSFRKPDAVFELTLTNADVLAETETKFEFKTKII